jgi:hypothetical protein
MFFSVIGPGIITANADDDVDVDVGGIQTYSRGAQFGYIDAVAAHPRYGRAQRDARNVRADGRRHRQRFGRSHP